MEDLILTYHIEPVTLRDIPDNDGDMRTALTRCTALLANAELPQERVRLYGMAGTYARLLGELNTARDLLEKAIRLAEGNGFDDAAFVNRIRLAHVHQWMKDFETSNVMFAGLLTPPPERLRDFTLQHAGKNAFDQGDYTRALAFFEQAMDIRRGKGDAELIASTQIAIDATKAKL